jgi:hypothetical protein
LIKRELINLPSLSINVDLKTEFLRFFFLDIYRSQTDYIVSRIYIVKSLIVYVYYQ